MIITIIPISHHIKYLITNAIPTTVIDLYSMQFIQIYNFLISSLLLHIYYL